MSVAERREFRKMLIADDDLCVVEILATKCKQLGFQVKVATNGLKAILKALEFKPDILVVDVHMPEATGFSVASHLDPTGKLMKVIAISGHFTPLEVERWGALGATCVAKGSDFWAKFANALFEVSSTNILNEMCAFDARVRKRTAVLLVDDDKSTTDFLSSRLDKLGVESVVASNGVTAFEIVKSESPAVIITDYYMPNGDAEYLLGKLRQTQETKHIPVIVHSGRKVDEHVIKGAARVVRKSHHGENLFHALKRYCGFVDPAMHFKEPVLPA